MFDTETDLQGTVDAIRRELPEEIDLKHIKDTEDGFIQVTVVGPTLQRSLLHLKEGETFTHAELTDTSGTVLYTTKSRNGGSPSWYALVASVRAAITELA